MKFQTFALFRKRKKRKRYFLSVAFGDTPCSSKFSRSRNRFAISTFEKLNWVQQLFGIFSNFIKNWKKIPDLPAPVGAE